LLVAIKVPDKDFIKELAVWLHLSHPNIVKLLDYDIDPRPYKVMELMNGALHGKTFDKDTATRIILDVLSGVIKPCYLVQQCISTATRTSTTTSTTSTEVTTSTSTTSSSTIPSTTTQSTPSLIALVSASVYLPIVISVVIAMVIGAAILIKRK